MTNDEIMEDLVKNCKKTTKSSVIFLVPWIFLRNFAA